MRSTCVGSTPTRSHGQRAGGADFGAAFGGACESFRDRSVEGNVDPDVEASPDEGKSQWLLGFGRDLDTQTTEDALARFVDDIAVLKPALEPSALPPIATVVGAIQRSIVTQLAVTLLPAVAVEASQGLVLCLFPGQA